MREGRRWYPVLVVDGTHAIQPTVWGGGKSAGKIHQEMRREEQTCLRAGHRVQSLHPISVFCDSW